MNPTQSYYILSSTSKTPSNNPNEPSPSSPAVSCLSPLQLARVEYTLQQLQSHAKAYKIQLSLHNQQIESEEIKLKALKIKEMKTRIMSHARAVSAYEDPLLTAAALQLLPPSLYETNNLPGTDKSGSGQLPSTKMERTFHIKFRNNYLNIQKLLLWFKNDFFSSIKDLKCDICNCSIPPVFEEYDRPMKSEAKWWCGVTLITLVTLVLFYD